jgi:haloalkane dehalogenase
MDRSRRTFIRTMAGFFGAGLIFPWKVLAAPIKKFQKRFVRVNKRKMAFHQAGKGDPILFLHGNPTSSYLWRNIIPIVSDRMLCIAPDLIGMGDSDKLNSAYPERYTFACHQDFLEKFIEKVIGDKKVILVGHDWGGVLSHDWARRHESKVRGIVLMETFLQPNITGETPEGVIQWFRNFHTEEYKHKVLQENHFVENVLLKSLPELDENDKEEYRRPFSHHEHRLPTLVWPQQVPIDRIPQRTHDTFVRNMEFMATTKIPKLFISAEPGAMLGHEARKSVIRLWPNLIEVKVKGNHFIQEQCPEEIGKAIARWIPTL